jgi:predicted ATP-dependent Lon-type protease
MRLRMCPPRHHSLLQNGNAPRAEETLASMPGTDQYRRGRASLTSDKWVDFLIHSIGLEPWQFDRQLKLLILVRLIPLYRGNFNLVELGSKNFSICRRDATQFQVFQSTSSGLYSELLSG